MLNCESKNLYVGRLNGKAGILSDVTIGDRIRDARQKAGWTMRELAARMKVSPSAVTQWESNQTTPSIANRADLSHLLKIPFIELVPELAAGRDGLTNSLAHDIVQLVPRLPLPVQRALMVQIMATLEALGWEDIPPEK